MMVLPKGLAIALIVRVYGRADVWEFRMVDAVKAGAIKNPVDNQGVCENVRDRGAV
jgi:hypothetical protein